MAFAAGQTLTAAQLNNITTKYLEARSSADETVTTSVVDVNGATLTFTTPLANTTVSVESYWDIGVTGGADLFIGTLYVDGVVNSTGEVHWDGDGAAGRATVAQGWTVTLVAAGSHTLKLRRTKTTNIDTVTLFGTHTKIKVSGPGLT